MQKEIKTYQFSRFFSFVLTIISLFVLVNSYGQENLDGLQKMLPKVNSNSTFQEAKNAFLIIEKDRAAVSNFFDSEEQEL